MPGLDSLWGTVYLDVLLAMRTIEPLLKLYQCSFLPKTRKSV